MRKFTVNGVDTYYFHAWIDLNSQYPMALGETLGGQVKTFMFYTIRFLESPKD